MECLHLVGFVSRCILHNHFKLIYTSGSYFRRVRKIANNIVMTIYEGWNFNSGNYLFTTDTK